MKLSQYSSDFVAYLLSLLPFCTDTFKIVDVILENDIDYWNIVKPVRAIIQEYDIEHVIGKLIKCNRYATAVNTLEYCKDIPLQFEILSTLLHNASNSVDTSELIPHAVLKIIAHMQRDENANIDDLSTIEWIYYPWFDGHSDIQPKALYYKISNDSGYFCSLVELFFKKENSNEEMKELDKPVVDRLASLFYRFRVVPGIDWSGAFDEKRFNNWIEKSINWGKQNDRINAIRTTIGCGLSYFESSAGFPNETILKELNKLDNEAMREGYKIGILNQRGVHYVDPEGKPEKMKAEEYAKYAKRATDMGYSGVGNIFKSISEYYLSDAAHTIREQQEIAFLTEE